MKASAQHWNQYMSTFVVCKKRKNMRNKEGFWLKQRWQQELSSRRPHIKTLRLSTPGAAWDHCLAKHWVMFSISWNTPALKDPGSASFTPPALTIAAAVMRTFHLFHFASYCRKFNAKAQCYVRMLEIYMLYERRGCSINIFLRNI